MSDQSTDLTFGIGQDKEIKKIDIIFTSGEIKTLENVKIDSRIVVE